MIGWLKALFSTAESDAPDVVAAAAEMDRRGEEVQGLNFRTAIEAHLKWKMRLEAFIDGTSGEQLTVGIVGRDDQCMLGKWIHGSGGERFRAEPGFGTLQAKHAWFHRCAAGVLSQAEAGDREGALKRLQRGEYARASIDVTRELASLYRRLA